MSITDFFKLRCQIHDKFKHWFSFNSKHKCLYCDWNATNEELNELLHFVEPYGLNVLFVLPCSVFLLNYEPASNSN